MKPSRPWHLRSPWFVLLIFGPALLNGWLVGYCYTYGWPPLIVMATTCAISGHVMLNAWHRYSAHHRHREDL